MEGLAGLLVWGALILLMMRFGCGAHMFGHRHGHGHEKAEPPGARAPAAPPRELRWVAPETDTDPVCGKTVRTAEARSAVHDGHVYYFCSPACREAFEAAPDDHLGNGPGGAARLEHRHA